jgi:hypothetical protein
MADELDADGVLVVDGDDVLVDDHRWRGGADLGGDAVSVAFAAAVRVLVAALPPASAEASIAVAEMLEACARTRSALRTACGPLH